jgi:hypothetical protein
VRHRGSKSSRSVYRAVVADAALERTLRHSGTRVRIDVGEDLAIAAGTKRVKSFADLLNVVFVGREPGFGSAERVVAPAQANFRVEMIEQCTEVILYERKLRLPRATI